MHKIYENIYIGVFIYLLGAISERKRIQSNTPSKVSIGLYQQTPFDPKIGDFFGALDGRMIIIEFKKDDASLGYDEIGRQHDLANLLLDNPELFLLSTHSHFIGIGTQENQTATITLKSYAPLESMFDECKRTSITMNSFIENYCHGKKANIFTYMDEQPLHFIGYEGAYFLEYLKILASLDKNKGSSGSGILFISIQKNGEIQCIPTDSIQTLVSMFEQSIEMNNTANETITQEAKNSPSNPCSME